MALRLCVDKNKVQFIPEKWEQGLGEICLSCKSRLTINDTISLCKCYLFCHEQCFLKEFSPYIAENQEVVCIRCNQEVQMQLQFFYRWEFEWTLRRVLPIVIGLLCIIVMLILVGAGVFKDGMSDGVGYGVFGTLLVVMVAATIFSLRRKYINLQQTRMVNTNLHESSLNANKQQNSNKNGYQNELNKESVFDFASAQTSEKDFDIQ